MSHRVLLTPEAENDLVDIHGFVTRHDSPLKTGRLLDRLEATCQSLAHHPLRGHLPPELNRAGVGRFREIHFKPYRIVYEVAGNKVMIHAVIDGRRDARDALERRLLRP
jgi:toxin ParE1/3/4